MAEPAVVDSEVNENRNGSLAAKAVEVSKTASDEKGTDSVNIKGESEVITESDTKVASDVKSESETKVQAEDDLKAETRDSQTNGKYNSESTIYKPKGKYDHNCHQQKRGSKFDPSVLPKSKDAVEIRNQVEFYFGDSNLPTDKFLWELTDGPSNKPVPIETVKAFGRMKRFEPYSAIVEALKGSEILEVSGPKGAEMVARKVAYDPNISKHPSLDRSVYIKGFGDEVPSSQFDIEAFFAPHGPTNAVRLRRNEFKEFKGSVFVEFADEEIAKKFLELDPKPLWQGEELQIMSKKAYEQLRVQEIKDGKREPNSTRGPKRGRGTGHHRGGDRKRFRDRDPDDWKKRREDDQKSGFRDERRERGRGGRGRGDRDRDSTKKRTREDEVNEQEGPVKRVDTKEGVDTRKVVDTKEGVDKKEGLDTKEEVVATQS